MTEADAKQRWCPFAASRVVEGDVSQTDHQIAVFLGPLAGLRTECLASGCMAWRWDSDFNEIMARVPPPIDPRDIADGRCGLAGKP